MDFEFDSSKEYPLDFSEDLSLQALASSKLALHLWWVKMCNTVAQDGVPVRAIWHRMWFEERKFSCQEVFNAPTRLRSEIDKQIVLVGEELRNWVKIFAAVYSEFLWTDEFNTMKPDNLLSILFDNIVLKPDNTICLESSARNALVNFPLKVETKYKIACAFCLEDLVRQYWPLLTNEFIMAEQDQLVLVVYWSKIMNKTPAIQPLLRMIESPAILSTYEINTAAFVYFWNKLNEEKQMALVLKILRSDDANYSAKFLLAKLNEIQARIVCQEAGHCIFGKLLMNSEPDFGYTMKCWIFMKDFIPGNIFFDIIRNLWKLALNHPVSDLETIDRSIVLFREMLITASDQLKTVILNRENFVRLLASLIRVQGINNYGVKFLLELLSIADYELRRTVWLENWRQLVISVVDPSKLEELMRYCFDNEEEIERFKEQWMANFEELGPYFRSCIEKKCIAELCLYLNFNVKNPRRLENLSKDIIFSNLDTILSWDDENEVAKIHSLIHGTFRDSQSADKFIQELILAPEFLALIYSKLDDGSFDEVIRISSLFSTSERTTNEMKRGLVDYCKNNLARGQIKGFKGPKLEQLFSWCSLDETTISEFKQSLIIDNIFEVIVKKAIKEGSTESHPSQTLLDFNDFLEWYFGSEEKAKIYKNSECVDRYLKWAFDYDTKQIALVQSILRK